MPHPSIINPPLPIKPNARYTREFPAKAEVQPKRKRKGKRRKKSSAQTERAKRRRKRLRYDPPMKTKFDLD
jgi:hypothetical protein